MAERVESSSHATSRPATAGLTRRKVLEVGAVSLAVLVVPACGGDGNPGPSSSGANSGSSSGGSSGTSAGASSGSGSGTAGQSGTSGSTTGHHCTPQRSCTNDANTLVIALADHPNLATVGTPELFTDSRYQDPNCVGHDQVYVTQTATGTFVAVSAACTHACCTVQAAAGMFLCPCHSSMFGFDGTYIGGPAPTGLPTLPVCNDGCNLYVQL